MFFNYLFVIISAFLTPFVGVLLIVQWSNKDKDWSSNVE